MANKIRYGFKNLYYAVMTTSSSGTITYGTPVKIPGAKSFTGDTESESSSTYADDIVYFSTSTNNGKSGDLTVLSLPDSFYTDVLNFITADNGMLMEDAYALPNPVALLFECQGDEKATRHIYYNVTLSAPSEDRNTKEESVEPDELTLSYTASPVVSGDYAWISGRCMQGDTGYDTFFTAAPTIPTKTSA